MHSKLRSRTEALQRGNIAIIAQSGGVNLTLAFLLENRGVGISLAVGLGNAVDLNTVDVLNHVADDPNTKAIVLHLEGIADGRELYEAIRQVSVRKPIVALFAGRSDIGAFAQSHTGRMLGSYERKYAMLRQAGAVVVETSDEAADAAWVLASTRLSPSSDPGVALVTGQAGPALLITDLLNTEGVRLAKLSPATLANVRSLLPPMTYLSNPVDTGRPGPQFPEVIEAITSDARTLPSRRYSQSKSQRHLIRQPSWLRPAVPALDGHSWNRCGCEESCISDGGGRLRLSDVA